MPYTLLLADDSVTIQRVIQLTFAHEDIAVTAVGDGDQAIALLGHTVPDIVLADIGMPGCNGYDLARHIKGTPALAHIPVLLLTGAFEAIDEQRAAEVGCDGVLAKPFEPPAVIQRVKELLATAQRRSVGAGVAAAREAAPVVASAPAASGPPASPDRLDDYFEQLDQAIAIRASRMVASPPPTPVPDMAASAGPLPAMAPALTEDERPWPAEPLMAGAFSALLAAEQSGAMPNAFAEWLPDEPRPASEIAAQPSQVTDATIDIIVQRVLERLSDRVADAVTAVTSATAERLVSEEIARIKSNIK